MAKEESTNGAEKLEVLSHGTMDVLIKEAKNLPNMDLISKHFKQCWAAFNKILRRGTERPHHHHHKKIVTSDPYVSIAVSGAKVAKTTVMRNSQNPQWNEHFIVELAHSASKVEFVVKDNDVMGAPLIGTVEISAQKILNSKNIDGWYDVLNSDRKAPKKGCQLHLAVQFTPPDTDPLYANGVGGGPDYPGVPRTYFPLRRGGSVSFYQDAHVPVGTLPEIRLDEGKIFEHNKCWEDICHAILEAHHLIYITGWSVFHKVKLIREPPRQLPDGRDLTLGDLLKYKSE